MDRRLYDQGKPENSNYNAYNNTNGYGGYNDGGYNNGGYNNNSYNSYNSYNSNYNDGGYNNNSYNSNYSNSNYSNGYNNSGYNNGGYSNGGYNNGGYSNGGYKNGGYNNGYSNGGTSYYAGSYSDELISSKIITRSFIVMLASLLVTAFAATFTAASQSLFVSAMNSFVILIIAEFALVFGTQAAIKKKNTAIAGVLYFGYTVVNGITLSAIFFVYELGSIQEVFFITALLFGVMAGIGAVTKKDLSSVGSIGTMLLIGVILVTLINGLFLHAEGIELLMDYLVVVIFVGLTAYDTQKMKRIATSATMDEVNLLAIYCGMELYLDFLNLFLRLLRIMGNSRN